MLMALGKVGVQPRQHRVGDPVGVVFGAILGVTDDQGFGPLVGLATGSRRATANSLMIW